MRLTVDDRFVIDDCEPGYRRMLEDGQLDRRVAEAQEDFRTCRVCRRDCDVDRRIIRG